MDMNDLWNVGVSYGGSYYALLYQTQDEANQVYEDLLQAIRDDQTLFRVTDILGDHAVVLCSKGPNGVVIRPVTYVRKVHEKTAVQFNKRMLMARQGWEIDATGPMMGFQGAIA